MGISIGEIEATLRLSDEMTPALAAAQQSASKFGEFLESTFGEVGIAAAAVVTEMVGVGVALYELTAKAASVGEGIERLALKTGSTVEEMSALKTAVTISGGSVESMGNAMFMLQKRLEDSGAMGDKARAALDKIGISAQEFAALTPDQEILKISSAYRDLDPAIGKAGVTMDLFGRQGKEMLPDLMKDLSGLTDQAKKMGLVWSTEDADAATQFAQQSRLLGIEFDKITVMIGKALMPVMNDLITSFATGGTGMDLAKAAATRLAEGLAIGVEVAGAFAQMFIATKVVMGDVLQIIDANLLAFEYLALGMAKVLNFAFPGKFKQDIEEINKSIGDLKDKIIERADALAKDKDQEKALSEMVDKVAGALLGVGEAHTKAANAAQGHTETITVLTAAQKKLQAAVDQMVDSWTGEGKSATVTTAAFNKLTEEQRNNYDVQQVLIPVIDKMIAGHKKLTPEMIAVYDASIRNKQAEIDLGVAELNHAGITLKLIDSLKARHESEQEIAFQLGTTVPALQEYTKNLDLLAQKVDVLSIDKLRGLFSPAVIKASDDLLTFDMAMTRVDQGIKELSLKDVNLAKLLDIAPQGEKAGLLFAHPFIDSLTSVLESAPSTIVQAFTGGGGIAGAGKAIGSMLGSSLMTNIFDPKVMDANTGQMVSKISGTFGKVIGAAIPVIGSLLGPAIDGLMALFGDHTGKDIANMATQWGVTLSDSLKKSITAATKTMGGELPAMLMNLDKIIAEGGGIVAFGIDKAISKTHDLFSMLETGKLTAQQVGGEFDKMFGQILPQAVDKFTGLASKAFLDLIATAQQFGTVSAQMTSFLSKQGSDIATGFNEIAAGMAKPLNALIDAANSADGAMEGGIAGMSNGMQKAGNYTAGLGIQIRDLTAKITDMENSGKALSASQTQQLFDWKTQLNTLKYEYGDLNATQKKASDDITAATKGAQDAFDRMGRDAVVAFSAALSSGQSFLQAIESIGPGLDDLSKAQTNFGLTSSGSFDQLMQFRQFASTNADLIKGLDGVNKMMAGLHNLGLLDQATFNDLTDTAVETFNKMVAGGVSGKIAMASMQPTLQTIWQMQKDFGFVVDDSTQALLDQAVQSGIVGEKSKTDSQKMVDALGHVVDSLDSIVQLLSKNLPDSAKSAADTINTQLGRITSPKIPAPWSDWGQPPDFGDGGPPLITEASGGSGRTNGPTLFYSAGNEDFAFSGEGKSFGSSPGGDTTHALLQQIGAKLDMLPSALMRVTRDTNLILGRT